MTPGDREAVAWPIATQVTAVRKLDDTLGTKRYFSTPHWQNGVRVDLARIVKAVEFFGGKLVIDWCDR